jgi:hypothetical protein
MAQSCEHPNRWLPYDDFGLRMRKLQRRFLRGNDRGDIRWGESGPIGLTQAIEHFGYTFEALPPWHFYPVPHESFRVLFESPVPDGALRFDESHAVHLWNNLLERHIPEWKGASLPADSPFEKLWERYMVAGAAAGSGSV